MTVERGFRRIVTVLSLGTVGVGLLFTVLIAGAYYWNERAARQAEAELAKEGCPTEAERNRLIVTLEQSAPTGPRDLIESLGAGRWRLSHQMFGSGAMSWVVVADRDLSAVEVRRALESAHLQGLFVVGSESYSRVHPMPGVEVLSCGLAHWDAGKVRRAQPAGRFMTWWIGSPLASALFMPLELVPWNGPGWLIIPWWFGSLVLLTAVVAAVPWGVFFFARWIARGFTAQE